MTMIRVNVRTRVNNAMIRREKRNGRDVIIVPSATMPDDVVMNNHMYPAAEIEKGYKTLERTPAPLGHPVVNGRYVSARDPEAINGFWVGAWNENVRRENGRVFVDKVIDVQNAGQTDQGKLLLAAIESGDPIHTSTGVLLQRNEVQDKPYKYIAHSIHFDHDAILLNEKGAATPDQGVGMMVNADGSEIEVVNMDLDSDMMESIAESIAWQIERKQEEKERQPIIDKIMAALKQMFADEPQQADGLNVNKEGTKMPITEEQFKALEAKVDTLTTNADQLKDTVTRAVNAAVEPLKEKLTQFETNQANAEKAEREKLSAIVVNAGLLDEETAAETSVAVLNKLAEKCKPKGAAPIVGHFTGNADNDNWQEMDLNANIDAALAAGGKH